MSVSFWVVAGLFCAFAFFLLLVPLWRYRGRAGRWPFAGLVATVLVVPAALALYFHVSDWDPEYAAQLARKMRNPPAAKAVVGKRFEKCLARQGHKFGRQDGDGIAWESARPQGKSHGDLRRYLDLLFGFASTRSLAAELRPVPSLRGAQIGDVFIRPGQPGHAVMIADMAVDAAGRRAVLLVQGSMPARGIYLLNNTAHPDLGAWFELADGRPLVTPGYEFRAGELRRF